MVICQLEYGSRSSRAAMVCSVTGKASDMMFP